MEHLASLCKRREVALLVGAGATRDGGGCTWGELASWVGDGLGLTGLPQAGDSAFELILGDPSRRSRVIELVRERLQDVSAPDALSKLLALDWLGICTTNYDTAIEDYLDGHGKAKEIYLGKESHINWGLSGVTPILKLSGAFSDAKSLVFTEVDRLRHRDAYPTLYEGLDAAARFQAILAVGYSFRDGLLLNVIRNIRAQPAHRNVQVFAVFPPDHGGGDMEALLKAQGVEIIRIELGDFATSLQGLIPDAPDDKFIHIMSSPKPIAVPGRHLEETISAFEILTTGHFEGEVDRKAFFQGSTSNLAAYRDRIPWERIAIREARDAANRWLASDRGPGSRMFINFAGRPGSGRTVSGLSLLSGLVQDGNAVAIRLRPGHHKLDAAAASRFMNALHERGLPRGVALVVHAGEETTMPEVLRFCRQVEGVEGGVIIIRSSLQFPRLDETEKAQLNACLLALPDDLADDDVESLSNYLDSQPREVVPTRLDQEEILSVIGLNNGSFLEAMWSFVGDTKKTFIEILENQYRRLDTDASRFVNALILPGLVGSEVPLHQVAKILDLDHNEIHLASHEAEALVKERFDEAFGINAYALFHKRVANALVTKNDIVEGLEELLLIICQRSNVTFGAEHQVVADLIVGPPGLKSPLNGVIGEGTIDKAFSALEARNPSRLLLHHIGIRYRNRDEFEKAEEILKRAIAQNEGELGTERREIVETTLAQTRWRHLKARGGPIDPLGTDVQNIRWDLAELRGAGKWNPNSYHIEAQILSELAVDAVGVIRAELLGEAVALLEECLRDCDPDDEKAQRLLSEVHAQAGALTLELAESLLQERGNGYGYYGLYNAHRDEDPTQAFAYLERAANAPRLCTRAIREFIHETLLLGDPAFGTCLGLSDRLFGAHDDDPNAVRLSWRDYLQRAALLVCTGKGGRSGSMFEQVRYWAPSNVPVSFPYHWKEAGSRRIFTGVVEEKTSSAQGGIHKTDVPGYTRPLFFNPSGSPSGARLKAGDKVAFTLAFGVRGIAAWDVSKI